MKKISELDKKLYSLGTLFILFDKKNQTERIAIENKNLYFGEQKATGLSPIVKDFFNEKYNNGHTGTTLVNFLNKSDDVISILNKFLEITSNINDIQDLINLTNELKHHLEEALVKIEFSTLLHNIFFKFDKDFFTACEQYNLYKLVLEYEEDNSQYSMDMYRYFKEIEDKRFEGKSGWYKKFSPQTMVKIFISSLIREIEFIKTNSVKDIEKYPKSAKGNKISNFTDLFYISKYNIDIINKKLKICERCGKYFITKNKISEKYCRRRYKNETYTCSELANKNNRQIKKDIKREISKEKNRIYSILKKQDNTYHLDKYSEYKKDLEKQIKNLNSQELNEEQKSTELLQWLKEKHEEYKLKNSRL